MISDSTKITCIDRQIEMARGSRYFSVTAWIWDKVGSESRFSVSFELDANEAKIEWKSPNPLPLCETVDEAYTAYCRFTGALPEFDANRTLEYTS